MKLLAGVLSTATALSDEEFAAFKCRPGQYYQYGVSDGGQGHAVDWNEYASASNNYAGCFPDMRLPCKRTDNVCKMETDWYAGRDGAMHQFTMNSIPDHNAWGMTSRISWIADTNSSIRIPKAPVMLDIETAKAQGARAAAIGFAVNGVSMYKPYNSGCCDAVYDELFSMDYCMGHPGNGEYHYHFHAYGTEYDGCLMSCNGNVESGIVGVAYDGFPFYGPMQYYSEREGKVYKDPSNCSDCELMQLNAVQTDACGGIEVADGDPQEGGQYRYIVSNIFPYNLQESLSYFHR